jgi:mono/diheme cytochrome c family protein
MKKFLIGIYLLITIGIIIVICTNNFNEKKDSKAIAAGEKLYQKQLCIVCHGKTGKGEGTKAGTALNNQYFLNTVSDKDLYQNIKYGRDGTAMPSYGPRISDKDIKNLVAFIRNWQTKEIKLDSPKVITGNSENGQRLYKLYCLTCHGENAGGMMKMGPALANPQYLKYTTDQQIWITTAYGRENTRMGSSLKGLAGVRQLKKQDINDIVTYIRSLENK